MPLNIDSRARVAIYVIGRHDEGAILGRLTRVPVAGETVIVNGQNMTVAEVFHYLDPVGGEPDAVLRVHGL